MRRVVLVCGLLVLCGLSGCGSENTTQTVALFHRQPDAQAVAAAKRFLNRYVTPDGRVVRLDQGGDTVGEGQAYGMLLAASIGDEKRFTAIWTWTQRNLRRPDGLISFLWRNGRVVDPQAASDADVDASRALLVGSCRFAQPALRAQALGLADAILRVEVGSFDGQPVLTAGPWAVTAPMTVNPSYFSPTTFLALRAASGNAEWTRLAESSVMLTRALTAPPARLPPDWARLEGNGPSPIGSPSGAQMPPQFGFDAVRTLVRMAEGPNPPGRGLAARAWPVFARQDPTRLPVNHTLSGRPIGDVLHPVVLVAAAGAADAAGQPAARDGLLAEAEALDRRSPTYYGSAWVALGRIMLTTKLLDTTCS